MVKTAAPLLVLALVLASSALAADKVVENAIDPSAIDPANGDLGSPAPSPDGSPIPKLKFAAPGALILDPNSPQKEPQVPIRTGLTVESSPDHAKDHAADPAPTAVSDDAEAAPGVSQAIPGAKRKHRRYANFSFGNFRLAGVGYSQSGDSVYTGVLSWNPEYRVNRHASFGLSLGGAPLSNALGENFWGLHYQATFDLNLTSRLGVELAAGVETWTTHGANSPLLGGDVHFHMAEGILERVFVGYSAYLLSGFYTSEIKLGVGVSL